MNSQEVDRLCGKIVNDKRKRGTGRYPWEFLNVVAAAWLAANGADKPSIAPVTKGDNLTETGRRIIRELPEEHGDALKALCSQEITVDDLMPETRRSLEHFALIDNHGQPTEDGRRVSALLLAAGNPEDGGDASDGTEEAKHIADKLSAAQRQALRDIYNSGIPNAGPATVTALVRKGLIETTDDEEGYHLSKVGKAVCSQLATMAE